MRNKWRFYWKYWVIPLIVVIVNLVFLGAHKFVIEGRLASLESQLKNRREVSAELALLRKELEKRLSLAKDAERGINYFYKEVLGKEKDRFTELVRELRKIARDSGLSISSISYPETEIKEFSLERKFFTFGVVGNYRQLFDFVSRIEVSDYFFYIDKIAVSQRDGGLLDISMVIATFFEAEKRKKDI